MKLKLKKDKLLTQKKAYFILIILFVVGCILGLILPMFLSLDNHELLKTTISSFFNNVMNNEINYQSGITNSLITNYTFLIGVWLLGISIIGIPVVLLLLIYKGFILGFSVSSIIHVYGVKGIIGAFTYIFPGPILLNITTILLTFYAVSFSHKLFRYLFLKESLNFKMIMNKYLKILLISSISFLIVSLSDVYLAPTFMKLFTFLIK